MTDNTNRILENDDEAVFIIGNGFDIDLNLPTKYSDFVTSDCWPFSAPLRDQNHRSLHNVLCSAAKKSKWFDIELLLTDYATLAGCPTDVDMDEIAKDAKNDYDTYKTLCQELTKYLYKLEEKGYIDINCNSVAARVLAAILRSGYFTRIFSFNYTNLKDIAKRIGIEQDLRYSHMHGDTRTGIILGIESTVEYLQPYRYLCKELNMNYRSRPLGYCMEESKEIVIFGHSLSAIDYHYFETLFQQQSRRDLEYARMKNITIFTQNEESKLDICEQLRNMNDRQLNSLFDRNILNIIRTDGKDEEEVRKFIERVENKAKDYANKTHLRNREFRP